MTDEAILTLNAGSSSIKFALFARGEEGAELARGQVENLGSAARLSFARTGADRQGFEIGEADHAAALMQILAHSRDLIGNLRVSGVGHRITHGGPDFAEPRHLDAPTLARLKDMIPWAPLHQPYNLAAVESAAAAFPGALQIGCFDTAFHRGRAWVNDAYGLPRRYYDKGVRRYGFHGLSYEFVTGELARIAPDLAGGKAVIAHLGNGASMCAVRGGRSVATTMGFTALDGLAMGTRCGQLDPGVLLYMLNEEKLTPARISEILYRESGLKGLSGFSGDMRSLEASDLPEAASAIDYFAHRIRYETGAMAAILGGLDAIVFCGGIGENSPTIRARVCEDMQWLGVALDPGANEANLTSIGAGQTSVFVIRTNEERVIARAVERILETAG